MINKGNEGHRLEGSEVECGGRKHQWWKYWSLIREPWVFLSSLFSHCCAISATDWEQKYISWSLFYTIGKVFINLRQVSLMLGPGLLVLVWTSSWIAFLLLLLLLWGSALTSSPAYQQQKPNLDAVGVNQSACLKIKKKMHFFFGNPSRLPRAASHTTAWHCVPAICRRNMPTSSLTKPSP